VRCAARGCGASSRASPTGGTPRSARRAASCRAASASASCWRAADAAILVLDEPTAHLDPATARDLVRDVVAAAGDASVLLITHRPEGLEHVDEIVELAG
jgi:ABC-type transport system involved in cytochrome bd biosynthesis fused ATPase/permease subunit